MAKEAYDKLLTQHPQDIDGAFYFSSRILDANLFMVQPSSGWPPLTRPTPDE